MRGFLPVFFIFIFSPPPPPSWRRELSDFLRSVLTTVSPPSIPPYVRKRAKLDPPLSQVELYAMILKLFPFPTSLPKPFRKRLAWAIRTSRDATLIVLLPQAPWSLLLSDGFERSPLPTKILAHESCISPF